MEYKYKSKITAWIDGKISGNVSPDGIAAFVRKWLYERAQNKCEACGWSKINLHTGKIPLNAHHKDGNYANTIPENLELLCGCCHSLTDSYGALNMGKGRKKRKENRQNERYSRSDSD